MNVGTRSPVSRKGASGARTAKTRRGRGGRCRARFASARFLALGILCGVLLPRPAGAIGGFTPGQRFVLSFASLWRENIRPEALRLQVNTDPHSPPEFRVNGPLSNLAEFAAAFNVPEGSPMRRPPADRVEIW